MPPKKDLMYLCVHFEHSKAPRRSEPHCVGGTPNAGAYCVQHWRVDHLLNGLGRGQGGAAARAGVAGELLRRHAGDHGEIEPGLAGLRASSCMCL